MGKKDKYTIEDYLSVIDEDIVTKLEKIKDKDIPNLKKADRYYELLKDYGFKLVSKNSTVTTGGLGTNRLTLIHDDFKNIAYKFALDSYGLDDNFYDVENYGKVERHSIVYGKHPSNLFSIHKRYIPCENFEDLIKHLKSIKKVLKRLSDDYVLVDISPKYNYKNYGFDPKTKDWVFIDCSDIFPYDMYGYEIDLHCTRYHGTDNGIFKCNGDLYYDEIYHKLVCEKCDHAFNPSEFKPKVKEENSRMKSKEFGIGLSTSELEKLNSLVHVRRSNTDPRQLTLAVTEEVKATPEVRLTFSERSERQRSSVTEVTTTIEKEVVIRTPEEEEALQALERIETSEDDSDDEDDEDDITPTHIDNPAYEDSDEDDDMSEEDLNSGVYTGEAYKFNEDLGSYGRSPLFDKGFDPIGQQLIILPLTVLNMKGKIVNITDEIKRVQIKHSKKKSMTVDMDDFMLALTNDELELALDEEGNAVTDEVGSGPSFAITSPNIMDTLDSYYYDLDRVNERLVLTVDPVNIKMESNEKVSINLQSLVLSSEDSLLFYRREADIEKGLFFEVLVADLLGERF